MKLKIISKESPQVYPLVSKARSLAESMGYTIVDSNPDVVMAIGGDGTLLRAIDFGKPIVTIKAGRRSFLMDVEPQEIENILRRLKDGDYYIHEYPLLRVNFGDLSKEVFNEAGVLYDEPESIIVTAMFQETSFTSEGDGILVSTPQGSTGWSMSITGVYLSVPNALEISLVSPILSAVKSLIVPRTTIKLVMESKGYDQKARIVADGNVIGHVKPGDVVEIAPSRNAIVYRFFKIDPLRGIAPWRK
ncbi:NAD kinase [Metallosphaera sp. J1]|uniref:NAD(+)/NADH kinase n=1 Tax=Metallosphaera TaxID=41980 RepID=UPI001EE076DF|nr:NAD(+)/NADH kinase [Metallosphaera javensis (ex Hofmann et al. 2022)]MCG3108509.1 NAD kinase [Metallosphaera javensis (ex Hofmann et al. 2022)]BCS92902.1 MAG: NAD kinase [Metallosphaera javensis (ex Sakai et al. 2022)]